MHPAAVCPLDLLQAQVGVDDGGLPSVQPVVDQVVDLRLCVTGHQLGAQVVDHQQVAPEDDLPELQRRIVLLEFPQLQLIHQVRSGHIHDQVPRLGHALGDGQGEVGLAQARCACEQQALALAAELPDIPLAALQHLPHGRPIPPAVVAQLEVLKAAFPRRGHIAQLLVHQLVQDDLAALAHLAALLHAPVSAERAGIGWLQVSLRQTGCGHRRRPVRLGLVDGCFNLAGVVAWVELQPRPLCV